MIMAANEHEITISKTLYKNLHEHSTMLGQIAIYVEEFCKDEETTVEGVLHLLEDYYSLKSQAAFQSRIAYQENKDK